MEFKHKQLGRALKEYWKYLAAAEKTAEQKQGKVSFRKKFPKETQERIGLCCGHGVNGDNPGQVEA